MDEIIPSQGTRQRTHIDLNYKVFKAGERVLYEPEFAQPRFGDIERMDGNHAIIDGAYVLVTNVKTRVSADRGAAWERALLDALAEAFAESPHTYVQARKRLVREHKRR